METGDPKLAQSQQGSTSAFFHGIVSYPQLPNGVRRTHQQGSNARFPKKDGIRPKKREEKQNMKHWKVDLKNSL